MADKPQSTSSSESAEWLAEFDRLCHAARRNATPPPSVAEFLKRIPGPTAASLRPKLDVLAADFNSETKETAKNAVENTIDAPPSNSNATGQGQTVDAVTSDVDPSSTAAADSATSKPADSMIGSRVAGYLILSELGVGAMGVVYKARQNRAERAVALKMVRAGAMASERQLERFEIEARAVAQLQHPNIVQIFEIGEWEGLPFFSLEFVDGGSLQSRLDRKPQPAKFAAEMSQSLAKAMYYAHERGILHRDLKPANILMTRGGEPKIADFGLAKQLQEDSSSTIAGTVMGTPNYMAPEQARGENETISPAADQYALGVILYEMLTGRVPFIGTNMYETLDLVRNREPIAPSEIQPGIPRDLETICLKCLQKEVGKRYANCNELAEDLGRFLRGEPILARPIGSFERMLRWCKRNPRVAALLATSFLLLTLVAAISLYAAVSINSARNDESKARAAEKEQFTNYRKTVNFAANELRKPIAGAIYTKYAQEEFSRLLKQFLDQSAATDKTQVNERAQLTLLLREIDELRASGRQNPDAVRAKYLTAIDLAEKMAVAETRDFDLAALNVAVCYSGLGSFEMSVRKFSDSFEWHSKALAVQERMLKSPRTEEYTALQLKGFVATSLNWVGFTNYLRGNEEEGIRQCGQSLAMFEEIAAADRSPENLAKMADVHFRLGTMHQKRKEELSAFGHLEKATNLHREMLALEPKNLAYKLDLSKALGQLGDTQFFVGKLAEAKKSYDESLVLTRELSDPKELLDIQRAHSATLYRAATTALKLGNRTVANKTFEECLVLREQFSKANPAVLGAAVELMLTLAHCGKIAEARIKAENLLKVAAAKKGDPQVPSWQLMCCFAYAICADNLDRVNPIEKWTAEQIAERKELIVRSLAALELAVSNGYKDHFQLETDPDADGVRGDPGFAAIISRLKVGKSP